MMVVADLEIIRSGESYLVKQLTTGRYVRLGGREAQYLCTLVSPETTLPIPAGKPLDEESKIALQNAFEELGLLGGKTPTRRQHLAELTLFSCREGKLYRTLVRLLSHAISLPGAVVLALSMVGALAAVNRSTAAYVAAAASFESHLHLSALLVFYGMFLVGGFFHEAAHLAACRRYTGCYGKFGMKLYFGLPALFADVNDMHRAEKKSQTVVTALAGVLMNLFLAALSLLVLPLLPQGGSGALLAFEFAVFNLLAFVLNLIPFAKYDGYWVLRSLVGINGLYDRSLTLALQLLRPARWKAAPQKGKLAMTLYGLGCYGFSLWLWFVFLRSANAFFSLTVPELRPLAVVLAAAGCVSFTAKYWKRGSL